VSLSDGEILAAQELFCCFGITYGELSGEQPRRLQRFRPGSWSLNSYIWPLVTAKSGEMAWFHWETNNKEGPHTIGFIILPLSSGAEDRLEAIYQKERSDSF
jgi:hypothetical protein